MNIKHNASITFRTFSRPTDGRRALGLFILAIFLTGLACSFPSEREADTLAETRIALDVQATLLMQQQVELTQQAASPPEVPITQPELPTQPPPTSPPPTPTETQPTPTDEPTVDENAPVEGSLIRAPYDPAADWDTGHDAETFDGTNGIFPSSSAGAAVAWYDEGRYHISFTTRGRWTWYWTFLDASNFYADVVIINGDKCVSGDTAGMVFRGDSSWDYGYMFGISCGGQYFTGITAVPGTDGIVWSVQGSSILFAARKLYNSDLIDTGPGAMNRIGVWAEGGDIDLYINGKWVTEFTYWGFPAGAQWNRGNLALYLGTAQRTNAKVSFEDFSIWYVP